MEFKTCQSCRKEKGLTVAPFCKDCTKKINGQIRVIDKQTLNSLAQIKRMMPDMKLFKSFQESLSNDSLQIKQMRDSLSSISKMNPELFTITNNYATKLSETIPKIDWPYTSISIDRIHDIGKLAYETSAAAQRLNQTISDSQLYRTSNELLKISKASEVFKTWDAGKIEPSKFEITLSENNRMQEAFLRQVGGTVSELKESIPRVESNSLKAKKSEPSEVKSSAALEKEIDRLKTLTTKLETDLQGYVSFAVKSAFEENKESEHKLEQISKSMNIDYNLFQIMKTNPVWSFIALGIAGWLLKFVMDLLYKN